MDLAFSRLPHGLFGGILKHLIEDIFQNLKKRNWQLAFAESCTGGALSAAFTSVTGISSVYQGAIVSYSNQAKIDLLSVPKNQIQTYGAVSERVALSMAEGARKIFKAQCAVSTTGIAGPGGGSADKPVGTVCFAAVGPDFAQFSRQQLNGGREEIQKASVEFALEFLLKNLTKE